jgi:leader peptidase (prepilin peptidase)/N-methyltransferase
MPSAILWFLVIGTGACVGSFLNVCIHRLPQRRSIVHPRSSCPACGRGIAWYDNIPILSYLLLRGRCRSCGAPIAAFYPLVEASTLVLFVLLFHTRGLSLIFLLHAALASAMVALILIDARHQILPDAITLPGVVLGLATSPFRVPDGGAFPAPSLAAVPDACIAAALGFAIPWSINAAYRGYQAARGVPQRDRQDGIGRGDFKLLAMIGAFLGVRLLLFTLFVAAIAGAAFGLLMMRFAGYGWKSKLPYGVFLGAAAILALFVGPASVNWYLRSIGVAP